MNTHLRDSVVAINQTGSWEDEVFRNKNTCTYKRLTIKYGHLQAQFA